MNDPIAGAAGSPTTYLVTGAQGYVGRYLVRALLDARLDAMVIGVGRSAHDGDALERYGYERADILDAARMREVLLRHRPRSIFHLAAGPRGAEREVIVRANVLGTISLMGAIVSIEG